MAESMQGLKRTHRCAELSVANIGETVTIMGWVQKNRNKGGLVFVDVRDRSGIIQVVCEEGKTDAALIEKAAKLRSEYVIAVVGKVEKRSGAVNENLATGEIEVVPEELRVLSESETPPFPIEENSKTKEEIRLKYRYLDLRRPDMQRNLMMRSKVATLTRQFLADEGFMEIETPILIGSTPEGARDYLVPSRIHHGHFYALPQSPQLFKQILMCSGCDRYFQIAKCFRDEDLRADRQTDFTQLDIETSFLDENQILSMMEDMLKKLMKDVKGIDIQTPFLRLSWTEAMDRYGSDKPDNRFGMELQDFTEIFKDSEFVPFKNALENKGVIKGIVVDDFAPSNKEIKKLTSDARKNSASGLVVLKYKDGAFSGSAVKSLSQQELDALAKASQVQDGGSVLIVSDPWQKACNALGALRNDIAAEKGLKKKDEFSFLWVVDFPMFDWSETENRWVSEHHPFTMPKTEDIPLLDTDPGQVKTNAYDCVLNGYELGGGSLRIYQKDLQDKIFEVLGFTEEQTREKFGFFIDAFQYGTPPHGGLAFGLDRIAMILSGTDSIRDVIAFPKNAAARDPMSDAPNLVDPDQLDELELAVQVDPKDRAFMESYKQGSIPVELSDGSVEQVSLDEIRAWKESQK